MGLFGRHGNKQETDQVHAVLDLGEEYDRRFLEMKARQAAEEQAVLDAIGRLTDPLAESALRRMELMADDEKSIFLRSAFQQLVLQSLDHTYKDYNDRRQNFQTDIKRLGSYDLLSYGTGSVCMATYRDEPWKEPVLDESMPNYHQSELPLGTF